MFVFCLHDSNLFTYFGLCGKVGVLVNVPLLMYRIFLYTYWHLTMRCLQVHFVLFSPDICNVWLNKASELLKH